MSLGKVLRRLPSRVADDPLSLKVVERMFALVRGSISPMLVRATRPREYDLRRTLVVCGFPRSGTTWLAEVLSAIRGTGIVFEPLDIRRMHDASKVGFDWENFVPPDRAWPAGAAYLQEVLSGRVQTRWTASQLPLSRAWRVERWIVKFVRANQMLGWIVSHFEIPPPVLLVRHPCAVYDSWVRRGWPVPQNPPPETARFFESYPAMSQVLADLKTPEEFFAADWAMQHYTPLSQMEEGTFQLRFYELLRADGPRQIADICQRWDVPVPQGLEKSLGRPSAKASGKVHSSGEREGPRWRSRLEEGVARRIMDVVHRFHVHLYASNDGP